MRPAVPSMTKLEIPLLFLATGDSFQSLELLFRLPAGTICKFLSDVLAAIKRAFLLFVHHALAYWNSLSI